MRTLTNCSLAPYTSLKVGGVAEKVILVDDNKQLVEVLQSTSTPFRLFGFGCNVLVSDKGLPGTTILARGGNVEVTDGCIVAEAGVWWDKVVELAIAHQLWGLELMSDIPGSVGGAVFGNIAAYGAQVSDTLEWIEVYDTVTGLVSKRPLGDFTFGYRESSLQTQPNLFILRAAFRLNSTPLHEFRYDAALAIEEELGLDHTLLDQRRKIVIETRRRAGSLYDPDDPNAERSAGSFFKNPVVSTEQARFLASFDETGKTLERVENQSKVHGGDSHRASAAHVLLAAGFHRGQQWKNVQLHDNHVLKIVTHDGATATEVYEVVQEILSTVREKLDIRLEPEVKFFGF